MHQKRGADNVSTSSFASVNITNKMREIEKKQQEIMEMMDQDEEMSNLIL